jgi:hypothetical protein
MSAILPRTSCKVIFKKHTMPIKKRVTNKGYRLNMTLKGNTSKTHPYMANVSDKKRLFQC